MAGYEAVANHSRPTSSTRNSTHYLRDSHAHADEFSNLSSPRDNIELSSLGAEASVNEKRASTEGRGLREEDLLGGAHAGDRVLGSPALRPEETIQHEVKDLLEKRLEGGQQHASSGISAHGIFWRSPALMISCFLLGMLASIGHHLFYSHFDGTIVGSPSEQEWNIRAGNFFALAVKIFLSGAVWYAFTQWLWRALKNQYVSIRGLDAAFHLETSMVSLLNPELYRKVSMGAFLALIAWCLQIPPLITPATLFVIPSAAVNFVDAGVHSLDIVNSSESDRFAYFTPANTTALDANINSSIFDGPRSILTRLSTATTSFGQILPISPPFGDSAYSIQFGAPSVMCNAANSTVVDAINAYIANLTKTLSQSSSGELSEQVAYAAFVPSFDTDPSNSIFFDGINITALDQPRLQEQPGNASNEIWLFYYRYTIDESGDYVLDPNITDTLVPMYSVCNLWNSTYDLGFSFNAGQQTVTNNSITRHNLVAYPQYEPNQPSDTVQFAFSALFWVLADQLVGSMGLVNRTQNGISKADYGSIDSNIEHNVLLGSNDLDYFFDLNSEVNNGTEYPLSDQRLLDKALAQNQTLPFLIEQLFFNITISLMNDPLLAPLVSTNTSQISPVNRYSYNVQNLWLAYGLANFFALIAVLLGIWAFVLNNASHNNAFSTLLSICRDPELADLFPECCHGKLPLPEDTMRAELKVQEMKLGGQSLVPKAKHKRVCKACHPQPLASPRPRGASMWTLRGARSKTSEVSPLSP